MVNKILKNKFFPQSLKIISLIIFLGLIFNGLSASSDNGAILKQLRNTNLSNLFVWSYWWPLIIIGAVLFGRIWCMICPVELITSISAKIGLKLKRPQWLLSGWVITIFYLVILIIGLNIFAIHRNPTFMAIYLLSLVFISILIGLIYEKNTFCRYVCPVGHLLGIYSRLSKWGWRIKDKSTCAECKDQSCVHKNHRYQLNYKSCGVDLHPAKIEDNTDCILCAGCMKTCNTYQKTNNDKKPNPVFTKVGFANGLYNGKALKPAEWFFLFALSGFVIYEILSEFSSAKSILLFSPYYLKEVIGSDSKIVASLIKSSYLLFLLPLIIWMLPYLIIKLSKIKLSIKEHLYYFGLSFIPIIATAHIAKSILKMSSRIPYFEHLPGDIQGEKIANAIVSGEIMLTPMPVFIKWAVTATITATLIAGFFYSIKTIKILSEKASIIKNNWVLAIGPSIYFLIFFIDIIIWRWI